MEMFILLFLAFAVSCLAKYLKSVSWSGYISMIIISYSLILLNETKYLLLLFLMFLSSSILTKWKKNYKEQILKTKVQHQGPRTAMQAFCNLGPSCILMICYMIFKNEAFLIASCSSIASSNADSWASEIGVLSKKNPILITNFKPISPGLSGGISIIGSIGGVLGAFFIALMCLILEVEKSWITVGLLGSIGMFIDSFLGATLQEKFVDNLNNVSEIPSTKFFSGIKGIDNHWVNFISNSIIGFIGCFI